MAKKDDINAEALDELIATDGQEFEQEQEEEDFAAGFSGEEVRPDEETVELEAEPSDQEGQKEEAQPQATDEPAELEANPGPEDPVDPLSELEKRLTARIRKVEGKNGTIISDLKQVMETSSQEVGDKGDESPSKEQMAEALESGEKFKALQDEFPEWAAAMEEQAVLTERRIFEKLPDFTGFEKGMSEKVDNIVQARLSDFFVEMKHEGWKNTVNTQEFGDWLKVQPQEVSNLADSDNAGDAIRLLDLYEVSRDPEENGTNQQKRSQKRLEAAVPATKGSRKAQRNAPSDEEEFEKAFNS